MFSSLESPASVVLFVARGKLGKPFVYSTVRPMAENRTRDLLS